MLKVIFLNKKNMIFWRKKTYPNTPKAKLGT